MIYSLATQVAAILPSNTPTGSGTITLTYNGATSTPAPITVVKSNLGIYTLNQAGSGPGVVTFANYQVVESGNAAHAGDVLILWATGLGPISQDDAAAPAPGDLTDIPLSIYLGVQPATVTYRGRSGCCAGLDQIVFTVPSGVEGCSVPLSAQIGNEISNYSSIAIAAPGVSTCSDPLLPISDSDLQSLLSKGTVSSGVIALERTTENISVAGTTQNTTTDYGYGSFQKVTFTSGGLPPEFVSPLTFDSCYVSTYSSASIGSTGSSPPVVSTGSYPFTSLDAGRALTVTGPAGMRTLPRATTGTLTAYAAALGNGTPGNFLDAGSYTITGPGGADVGPFSVTFNLPQPLTWSNQSSVATVNRSAGQLITWTGGNTDDLVYIFGDSTALQADNSTIGGEFQCLAHAGEGSFMIPSSVLLALPATSVVFGVPIPGIMSVISSTSLLPFTAPGLDIGLVSATSGDAATATFQ